MENQQPWKLRVFSFRNATILITLFNLFTLSLLLHRFLGSSNRRIPQNQPDPGMSDSSSLFGFWISFFYVSSAIAVLRSKFKSFNGLLEFRASILKPPNWIWLLIASGEPHFFFFFFMGAFLWVHFQREMESFWRRCLLLKVEAFLCSFCTKEDLGLRGREPFYEFQYGKCFVAPNSRKWNCRRWSLLAAVFLGRLNHCENCKGARILKDMIPVSSRNCWRCGNHRIMLVPVYRLCICKARLKSWTLQLEMIPYK